MDEKQIEFEAQDLLVEAIYSEVFGDNTTVMLISLVVEGKQDDVYELSTVLSELEYDKVKVALKVLE